MQLTARLRQISAAMASPIVRLDTKVFALGFDRTYPGSTRSVGLEKRSRRPACPKVLQMYNFVACCTGQCRQLSKRNPPVLVRGIYTVHLPPENTGCPADRVAEKNTTITTGSGRLRHYRTRSKTATSFWSDGGPHELLSATCTRTRLGPSHPSLFTRE